jgi:predicted small metal-binding protein
MSAHDAPKMKRMACGQIVPDCGFTASAATEAELLKQVAEHAAHTYGITVITPELAAQVKAAIRTE